MAPLKTHPSTARRTRSSISRHARSRTSVAAPPVDDQKKGPRTPTRRRRYMKNRPSLKLFKYVDRKELARIAQETIDITHGEGSYTDVQSGLTHNIVNQVASSISKTCIYASTSSLMDIDGPRLLNLSSGQQTQIEILQSSPLRVAHSLSQTLEALRDAGGIGFLNCCSAKRPGGGFLNGGTEKEECLARASTLYASLSSGAAASFYRSHKRDDASGFYDHQIIFTPHIAVIRADRRACDLVETGGGPLIAPFYMSVVSSCAINAAQLRGLYQHNMSHQEMNQGMEDVMRSRMAHILRVFEERGIRNLVLAAFGVGQPFFNNVDTVARIWADLLFCPCAVFKRVFDRVWFSVDAKDFPQFKAAFHPRPSEEELNVLSTVEPDADDLEPVDLGG